MHQTAFNSIKTAIAKDVVLAYPDYSQGLEIYADSFKFQLGAIITQNNRLLAFFSCKLNKAQQKYNLSKQELLAIVESLKEFNGIRNVMGSNYHSYTDHKNLMEDALGLASDQVFHWRLL